jgi:hypothetical protein
MNPVRPRCSGYPAQQALHSAGTIANGKVSVDRRTKCEHDCLGLFARSHWSHGDVVTLYGGVITPVKETSKSHSRHDRGLGPDYAYDGLPFSRLFARDVHGPHWRPRSPDSVLSDLIEHSGIGWMANTVTKNCPAKRNSRPNVTIKSIDLVIKGIPVPNTSVLALVCGKSGIVPGDEIISVYEHGQSNENLAFSYTIQSIKRPLTLSRFRVD